MNNFIVEFFTKQDEYNNNILCSEDDLNAEKNFIVFRILSKKEHDELKQQATKYGKLSESDLTILRFNKCLRGWSYKYLALSVDNFIYFHQSVILFVIRKMNYYLDIYCK